jgi:hypothetical protein
MFYFTLSTTASFRESSSESFRSSARLSPLWTTLRPDFRQGRKLLELAALLAELHPPWAAQNFR